MKRPPQSLPAPPPIDWLPWCLSESAETSPHPGALPPVPAGGAGWLIAPERGHLADCRTDLEAVSRWLARQKDNPLTLEAYRHELERFLLWLGLERGKALSEATGEDISLFDDLLQYPERWPQWYGERHPRADPRWRPWTCKLSARSRHEALTTVERCYAWLIKQGYLRYNPFEAAALRLRAPRLAAVQARYLDERLWQAVLEQVPIPPALIEALSRYRSHLGLSPLPEPGEPTPMVLSQGNRLCRKLRGRSRFLAAL